MITPKRLVKRLTAGAGIRATLCWLAAQYMRLVWATGRWTIEGEEHPKQCWAENRPFIVAFWHARLLMMPYAWTHPQPGAKRPFRMLISQHRDGKLIADTVAHFGISTIAGSTTRGAGPALRALLKTLKDGQTIGITPDGPKGPRMRATMGVVGLARASGAVVIPLTYATGPGKILGTWDRFLVPLPFGRGLFIWGRPIAVPRDASEDEQEALRAEIEHRLNAITGEADARMGIGPVEPAPMPAASPS